MPIKPICWISSHGQSSQGPSHNSEPRIENYSISLITMLLQQTIGHVLIKTLDLPLDANSNVITHVTTFEIKSYNYIWITCLELEYHSW